MRALIVSITVAVSSFFPFVPQGAAKDHPSPQGVYAVRVDSSGARLVIVSSSQALCTIASREDVADADGWDLNDARWHRDGRCVVVRARWGKPHRYQTLKVFRVNEDGAKASAEELDLAAPFAKLLAMDKDRELDAEFAVADAIFGYGDVLSVTFRKTGTGSAEWAHELDADYYVCDFTFVPGEAVRPVGFRRVRTTEIPIE